MSTLTWPLLLLVLGLAFLLAEAFVPSAGMLPVLAVLCLALSLGEAFRQSTDLGLKFLLTDAVLTPLTIGVGLYLWQKSPLAAKMTLRAPAPDEVAVSHASERVDHLVGQHGRCLTPLKPLGVVDFDGRRLEGIAEEGLIPEGTAVQAVRVHCGRLVVRVMHMPDPAR